MERSRCIYEEERNTHQRSKVKFIKKYRNSSIGMMIDIFSKFQKDKRSYYLNKWVNYSIEQRYIELMEIYLRSTIKIQKIVRYS